MFVSWAWRFQRHRHRTRGSICLRVLHSRGIANCRTICCCRNGLTTLSWNIYLYIHHTEYPSTRRHRLWSWRSVIVICINSAYQLESYQLEFRELCDVMKFNTLAWKMYVSRNRGPFAPDPSPSTRLSRHPVHLMYTICGPTSLSWRVCAASILTLGLTCQRAVRWLLHVNNWQWMAPKCIHIVHWTG